jgi:MFS family permease
VAGALTHRNFRLLWFAALGSTIGTWMQKFAQSRLVVTLTGSGFYLSLDDLLSQLPIILFMLIGGVVADRYDRRRLLTGSQIVQMFSAFMLALLVITNHVTIWGILALSFVSGCGQAFGGPAYQSLIPSLVPRRDLPNAIALNSTQFNLSRVLGPMFGAGVVLLIGAAWCFSINAMSFLLVIAALAVLKVAPQKIAERRSLRQELASGLSYVRNERPVLTLTVLIFICTFLAMPISTLVPLFAIKLFGPGTAMTAETGQAVLMAAQGLGAIVGALIISSFERKGMGRLLLIGQILLGVIITAFALSPWWPLSCLLLFLSGIVFMLVFSASFSLVQMNVPDALRGRVVSIYMVAMRGGWPLGGLLAGVMADKLSPATSLTINGVALAVLSAGILALGRGRSLRQL